MTNDKNAVATSVMELRQSFDQSFARAPQANDQELVDLLSIRVAGALHALRLSQLSGLHACGQIVPLAGPVPELLGMIGLRGKIVPVYSLRLLLGYPAGEHPGWLALVGGNEPVGLAFDGLGGHRRIPKKDISAAERAKGAAAHVHEVAQLGGAARPIIDLVSVCEGIKKKGMSES